ncbi:MAG: class I SAM-dependent methyltransferase [Burkholderiales bacterium]
MLSKRGRKESLEGLDLYCCNDCRTVYLGAYSDEYVDELYDYYRTLRSKSKGELFDPATRLSYERVLALFARHGGGNRVLDVGCGIGGFVDAALSNGYSAEGIDLSHPAVEVAMGVGLPVSRSDFFSADIQMASRDVVTLFEVIEHVPQPVAFLRRAEEVVKPGGLVYITTPNFGSLDRRILGAEWKAIHPEHLTYFTPSTLLAAVHAGTSLEVVRVETRNVSAQLLEHAGSLLGWRRGRREEVATGNAITATEPQLRARMAASPGLSLLKRTINAVLDATSLGETIVLLLRRPA